ncbi:hypothetical protein RSAG8_04777, partial [Rhizoctonia solani AG-8 WAC10335]
MPRPSPTPYSSSSPYSSPAPSTPHANSCQYHPEPNPKCLGCRMAMGGQPDSFMASDDFSVQQCYYSDQAPADIPGANELVPLSPTSQSSDNVSHIPGESDEESYLLRMRYAMQEMDTKIEFVVGKRFLDLGCCPGGFSTYVLSKLPDILGDGVSLPVELGGHSLAIPQALQSRFTVHWGDITRFNHAAEHSGSGKFNGLATFPIPPNSYDLVIADGHRPPVFLRQLGQEHPYARDLLLVSQMLAAIRAVKVGGSILIKLSLSLANQTLDGFMHRVVIALGGLSTHPPLVALKPKSIYATAGSFYVLVRPPVFLRQLGQEHPYARDLLLVSQMLAAIRAVKVGGSILIKLSLSLANQTLDGFMHRVVIALGGLSTHPPLVALKPKSIYATAGSFYVLVRGVEAIPRRGLELKLETLWISLLEGVAINTTTLNRLVSAKETKGRREWLVGLLAPVKGVRNAAMQR